MTLDALLPPILRGPSTTITPIAAGLSGAGVYRVEAAGRAYVLKVADAAEPLADWRRRASIQQAAAAARLAPPVVHTDEAGRAIVSDFVAGRPFLARFADPSTRGAALAQLGRTVRRVHDLPLPADARARDPRELLAALWSGLAGHFTLPAFVGDAVRRMLAEEPPTTERPLVLSHNDVNPTNLICDGDDLLLVDWDTAGPNDPFYDLAAISVFLRLDDAACRDLLAAHDGQPAPRLPACFTYNRRLVAVLCGAAFLHLARLAGHAGATQPETPDAAPSLGDFYQQLQSGALSLATGDGRWSFGLALVKTSFELRGA